MNPLYALVSVLLAVAASVNAAANPLDPLLGRPLVLKLPSDAFAEEYVYDDAADLHCYSWRVAAEANNLAPWKTIPPECVDYVEEYMVGRSYHSDLEMVSGAASEFARSVEIAGDGKDVWIFDIDETLLSNLPYYVDHGFGLEIFNALEFDRWVGKGIAPAIESSLKLYEEVLGLGFKIFLLTGRSEEQRNVTSENLRIAGFRDWDTLILRGLEDHGKTATVYKSEKRSQIVAEGYRIMGNSGDQWSDLLGSSTATRSFKLPNPIKFIMPWLVRASTADPQAFPGIICMRCSCGNAQGWDGSCSVRVSSSNSPLCTPKLKEETNGGAL